MNTIGSFGCLFVCAINVGNSYNKTFHPESYEEQKVKTLASNSSYFHFWCECNWISDYCGMDFASGSNELKKLLADMTGENLSVEKFDGDALTSMAYQIRQFKKGAYIIAKVGGHFINITNIDKTGQIFYFDPYIRNTPKTYVFDDIEAFYLITTTEENHELN